MKIKANVTILVLPLCISSGIIWHTRLKLWFLVGVTLGILYGRFSKQLSSSQYGLARAGLHLYAFIHITSFIFG